MIASRPRSDRVDDQFVHRPLWIIPKMLATMKLEGPKRALFTLAGPPPKTYQCSRPRPRPPAPIFEPYLEALPLEAGYYSFALDSRGRFRVERGNTRSHGGMVGGDRVGAAGHFQITRSGKVGRVVCLSNDYWLYVKNEEHVTVKYLIESFERHQAFVVSPHATFQFSRSPCRQFLGCARRLDRPRSGRTGEVGRGGGTGIGDPPAIFGSSNQCIREISSPTSPPDVWPPARSITRPDGLRRL